MRHTEVTEPPCDHGNNIDDRIRLFDTCNRIVCSHHRQISRKRLCVLNYGRDTSGNIDAEYKDDDQGNRHDNTLNEVCC